MPLIVRERCAWQHTPACSSLPLNFWSLQVAKRSRPEDIPNPPPAMEQVLQGDETIWLMLGCEKWDLDAIRIASMSYKAFNNRYQAVQFVRPCTSVLVDSMLASLKTIEADDSITFAPLYTTPAPYSSSCDLRLACATNGIQNAVNQEIGLARSFRLLSNDSSSIH